MPTTPITNPVFGESLVGTEPQLLQRVDPGWRHRLNLFTGRALTDTALTNEQLYRSGRLTTLGQSVTAGTVNGLGLTIDTSGADPLLIVTPGYGIAIDGSDVALNRALKTRLSTLAVVDISSGTEQSTFHEFVGDPTNTTHAGILILQPVVAQVSGQLLDTGTGPVEVSGNLAASCDQDPEEYAFEDWQNADAVRLVFVPWPIGIPALPLPAATPQATWRNRLAYTIFEAESLLGPDDALPWAMLGVPVALIAFDPGIAWGANAAFSVGQFITDPNGNVQQVKTAGTSGRSQPGTWNGMYGGTTTDGTITWFNNGLAWKPLFVDCFSVVRAGGLPRRRSVLPAQPPPLRLWQANTLFAVNDFVVDTNGSVQLVKTAGRTGGPPPAWATTLGQATADGTVTWINNGPASWKPNTAYGAGQFIFDPDNNQQAIQTVGTSGNTQPDWNGVYLPTSDGTITWINNGAGNPPVVQPALAQARIAQLSEQLGETMAQQLRFTTLADIFPTLPPSAILPAAAVNFVTRRASWLPPNWSVSAAPVHLEELETVLQTGMTEALLEAQPTAPNDPTLLEPVELLVPLPDTLYDPNILVQETVAPVFQQEVNKATQSRNLTLQRIKTVQEELNALFTVLGPNLPANPNLCDVNAGLTPQEIQARNAPPPYTPAPSETLGTTLRSTWQPSTQYAVGQFVIDSNGTLQICRTAGTSGSTNPVWNTTVGQSTPDGTATWMNNGPWAWQPNTAYVAGQFIADPNGLMQVVQTGGISASSQPNWNAASGATTLDGIIWIAGGNAQWQPDVPFTVGQVIFDSNGNIQIVQNGGISGDSAPAWNRFPGLTTQDSGVTWTNLGHSHWQPNTGFSAQQAIVDSKGNIQLVQTGGTSGATQPTWNETPGGTTMDAAVTWSNNGALTWQPNKTYSFQQIVIDSNGNLQATTGAGPSFGTTQPVWNTTPGQVTREPLGFANWLFLPYNSTDYQHLMTVLSQPPYTTTFTDSLGNSHNLNLLSPDDLADLNNNGLPHFINRLNSKISQANDLIDTAFLTVQTDIYRFRQNVLGTDAASSLATSPILANIASGETAAATATNLQNYINTLIPPTGSTTPPPTYVPPTVVPISHPVLQFTPRPAALALASRSAIQNKAVMTRAAAITTATSAAAAAAVTPAAPVAPRAQLNVNPQLLSGVQLQTPVGIAQQPSAGITFTPGTTFGISHLTFGPSISAAAFGPTQIVVPGQNAPSTPSDITGQSPLVGAQLNIRTLTIAARLQISPSQEAMFYAISNRLSFLQLLQTLEQVLEIAADDLPIEVDGAPAATTAGQPPPPVPMVAHTFSEWLNPNQQPAVSAALQAPVYPSDPPEATLFSVGVRVVEQHTMLLRALEARINQYVDFVSLCSTALGNIQNDVQQARVLLTQLQNKLLQDRQNVAFTTALLQEETLRVQNVNAQRLQVLQNSVQLVAYTRPRTLNAIDTTPSRQLVPANVASPVPACLQQSVAIPPELREIVGLLREAPVSWMPPIATLLNRLERPILLQQLALAAVARAVQQLTLPLLPSSAVGEPGVYAPAISTVYSANQQLFRTMQTQRAAFQPATLANLSWSLQVASVQSMAAVNDLISAESVHTEVSNATSRLIQQISSVATCLYTRVSVTLPIDRLAWAEFLRGTGLSVQLQSLAVLPNWTQQAYLDRQQMQLLVDWLFQQIDTGNTAATAFMSDVVRTAILLASDVPIDNIIPGNILIRTQPIVGGVISLNLPSQRIASGMYVHLYSGATLAARAVVSDLDSHTVTANVTDVFTPGAYLETSDVAHFTAQTPQAVALRPFLMQS